MNTKVLANGTKVKINHGFGLFMLGEVVDFDAEHRNVCGHKRNYRIKATGGVDCFEREVVHGSLHWVHESHVTIQD